MPLPPSRGYAAAARMPPGGILVLRACNVKGSAIINRPRDGDATYFRSVTLTVMACKVEQ
jgi:hypothetical protein